MYVMLNNLTTTLNEWFLRKSISMVKIKFKKSRKFNLNNNIKEIIKKSSKTDS